MPETAWRFGFPSANQEEAVFENPYIFDLRRTPNEHLAFSKANTSAGVRTWRVSNCD